MSGGFDLLAALRFLAVRCPTLESDPEYAALLQQVCPFFKSCLNKIEEFVYQMTRTSEPCIGCILYAQRPGHAVTSFGTVIPAGQRLVQSQLVHTGRKALEGLNYVLQESPSLQQVEQLLQRLLLQPNTALPVVTGFRPLLASLVCGAVERLLVGKLNTPGSAASVAVALADVLMAAPYLERHAASSLDIAPQYLVRSATIWA